MTFVVEIQNQGFTSDKAKSSIQFEVIFYAQLALAQFSLDEETIQGEETIRISIT